MGLLSRPVDRLPSTLISFIQASISQTCFFLKALTLITRVDNRPLLTGIRDFVQEFSIELVDFSIIPSLSINQRMERYDSGLFEYFKSCETYEPKTKTIDM